jgi:TonB family protein
LEEQLDFLIEGRERSWRDGVSWPVIASVVLHIVFITWAAYNYHPVSSSDQGAPIAHYVVLMKQNPQFTEAPGRKVEKPPLNAPFSDANRKASMPNPTGQTPTKRPGDGSNLSYNPPTPRGDNRPASPASPSIQQAPQAPQPQQADSAPLDRPPEPARSDAFVYRHQQNTQASLTPRGNVDWKNAIREVGKVASLGGGQQGPDLSNAGGGEKGFAENGPLSFETQWYDWGEYAAGMVSRIKVNWYANMPQIIQTGLKGVVTIRFTIHRDGRISDVTMLESSGVPPYDFAAKKAIELSSPLNPLPPDFPNNNERVTCMFYYNLQPPAR